MVTYGEKEITQNKNVLWCTAKKAIKIWDVNVDNIVVSKLVETKTNIKYLIGIRFGKAI